MYTQKSVQLYAFECFLMNKIKVVYLTKKIRAFTNSCYTLIDCNRKFYIYMNFHIYELILFHPPYIFFEFNYIYANTIFSCFQIGEKKKIFISLYINDKMKLIADYHLKISYN